MFLLFYLIIIRLIQLKLSIKIIFFYMIPDHILRKAIDTAYYRYDRDHSNTLSQYELENCLRDVLHLTGCTMPVNSFIVGQLLKRMDKNHDGQISKREFLNMFRWFQSNSGSMGGFGGGNCYSNQYNGNNGYYQNNQNFNQQQPRKHWWNKFTQ